MCEKISVVGVGGGRGSWVKKKNASNSAPEELDCTACWAEQSGFQLEVRWVFKVVGASAGGREGVREESGRRS